MALADGQPAEAWDVWVRIITDGKYVKKDGTLHNSAFSGKKTLAPPAGNRPWSYELSGGLLSLIEDLRACGVARCGEAFSGFMFQKVENIRTDDSGFPTDVIFTPNADNAHADLAFYFIAELTDEIRFELRDWLQDLLLLARPDGLQAIDFLRQPAG